MSKRQIHFAGFLLPFHPSISLSLSFKKLSPSSLTLRAHSSSSISPENIVDRRLRRGANRRLRIGEFVGC
ncbi:hypothetical protein LOK49_LG09G01576 [Camellia lanceoleosa]|uniref:Uncharacterized protein n=1 Tax=Camellia lanceoleosa TaxID=1840588 RepID=A0ACC0GDG8_9ERIC|nr:hypothetical protein LOK49_LG09G01576 [Camellia lanceoleosa]